MSEILAIAARLSPFVFFLLGSAIAFGGARSWSTTLLLGGSVFWLIGRGVEEYAFSLIPAQVDDGLLMLSWIAWGLGSLLFCSGFIWTCAKYVALSKRKVETEALLARIAEAPAEWGSHDPSA